MSIYSHPPALGWQTNPYTATGDRVDFTNLNENKYANAAGYYEENLGKRSDFSEEAFEKAGKEGSKALVTAGNVIIYKKIHNSNLTKYWGYVPLVGTLIGAGRISSTIADKNLPIKNKLAHILRGSVEFLSLGFLLLIPDLILNKFRHFHKKLPPASDFSVNTRSLSVSSSESLEEDPTKGEKKFFRSLSSDSLLSELSPSESLEDGDKDGDGHPDNGQKTLSMRPRSFSDDLSPVSFRDGGSNDGTLDRTLSLHRGLSEAILQRENSFRAGFVGDAKAELP